MYSRQSAVACTELTVYNTPCTCSRARRELPASHIFKLSSTPATGHTPKSGVAASPSVGLSANPRCCCNSKEPLEAALEQFNAVCTKFCAEGPTYDMRHPGVVHASARLSSNNWAARIQLPTLPFLISHPTNDGSPTQWRLLGSKIKASGRSLLKIGFLVIELPRTSAGSSSSDFNEDTPHRNKTHN